MFRELLVVHRFIFNFEKNWDYINCVQIFVKLLFELSVGNYEVNGMKLLYIYVDFEVLNEISYK